MLLSLTFVSGLQAESLDIYFIDVEGGAATLIVSPRRQAVLIDTGWARDDNRDARRIHEVAAKQAGLQQIDYLITTHFHRDHYGGLLSLSRRIPIREFFDHGRVEELKEDPQFPARHAEYLEATRGKARKLSPGDEIPLQQGSVPLQLICLVSNGEVLHRSGEPNPECSALQLREDDPSDNAKSVGVLLKFGDFEFLDLGDLTWNVEAQLACPANIIGRVDVYQVTHHGLSISNNAVLVRSVHPSVAIVNNGPRKGGHPEVFRLLKSLPGIQDIFQVHLNLQSPAEDSTAPELIANLESEEECKGRWIRLSVSSDASTFTVTNSRNGVTRRYPVR